MATGAVIDILFARTPWKVVSEDTNTGGDCLNPIASSSDVSEAHPVSASESSKGRVVPNVNMLLSVFSIVIPLVVGATVVALTVVSVAVLSVVVFVGTVTSSVIIGAIAAGVLLGAATTVLVATAVLVSTAVSSVVCVFTVVGS